MNTSWKWMAVILVTFASGANLVQAAEPNESFGQATLLAPGVISVSDTLTPGYVSYPDTMLGILDYYGQVYYVDDDGSPLGNGYASGVGNVPTNSGSIDFAVSGNPDQYFEGNHSQSGDYKVYVDAYDFFGDLVDSFSVTATLQPGAVQTYSYSDYQWISGSYDVYIDNTIGGVSGADVDFFTFTGLTPGATYTAQTTQTVPTDLDTYLGRFDATGSLVEFDSDSGTGWLSLLTGTVPTNGKLTFAVTGEGDTAFTGSHVADGNYNLVLSVAGGLPGDFNGDGNVDGQDFLRWQRNPSVGTLATWLTHYGTPLVASATAVPEPGGIALILAFVGGAFASARRG
jgi:hypothetical protein